MEPAEEMKETGKFDLAEFAEYSESAACAELPAARPIQPAVPVLNQYRLFDRSFRFELALFTIILPILATLWIFVGYYYHYIGRLSLPIMRAAGFCTIVYIFAHIFYGNARAAARAGSIIVGDGRVARKYGDAMTVFNLADLKAIRRPRFGFLKRMLFMSRDRKFSIPLSVRGSPEMVEKIFNAIEAAGISVNHLAALKSRFYDVAKRASLLQRIRAENQPCLTCAVAATAILQYVTVIFFWERGLNVALISAFVCVHLQVAAYLLTEKLHVRKIVKLNIDGDGNDGGDDFSGYYVMAGVITLLFGMALGVAFMMLFGHQELLDI